MSDAMRIVDAARSMIGTPFHHQGRQPGVGVDCVGLVICVARQLGYVSADFDVTGYSRIPDGVLLTLNLGDRLIPVQQSAMQPGDVVCVAFDKFPQHVGIVGDYLHGGLSIIHSASKHGSVVETRLMFTPSMRFVAAYRFPEVA